MSIVTLGDAKAQLNITGSADDAELQGYVDGITKPIENYKREVIEARQIVDRVNVPVRYDWRYGVRFRLWSVPLISVTSIASLDGTVTYPVDSLDIEEDTGLVEVISGPAPCGRVKITYQAGYTVIPENYKRGALVVLQHVWETQRGAAGAAAGVMGAEEGGTRDPWIAFTLPRKALEWLGAPRPIVG